MNRGTFPSYTFKENGLISSRNRRTLPTICGKTQVSKITRRLRSANRRLTGGAFLTRRIDRSELRLDHFTDKLAESPSRLPAKCLANLVRATDEPVRFRRSIECRTVLHIFLPWKIDNGESRLDKFAH